MPLVHSKSKKAFAKNVETEMKSGKPQDQSLAIAFSVKRKAAKKKMTEGGKVNESAVTEHRPSTQEHDKDAKELAEINRPAPKRGITNLKGPRTGKSDVFSIKPRSAAAEEDHAPRMHPGDGDDMEKAPPSKEFMAGMMHGMKHMMAEGGDVGKQNTEDSYSSYTKETKEADKANSEDSYKGSKEKNFLGLAEGGDVHGDDHEDEEHDISLLSPEDEHKDSIAAAIMAKRDRKLKMAEGGEISERHEHEGDEMLKEGEVDLDDNAREIPNSFYHQNEDEALEENLDHDLMEKDQPEDSNEHGDKDEEEESDPHDMVSSIRRKMSVKRQFPKD